MLPTSHRHPTPSTDSRGSGYCEVTIFLGNWMKHTRTTRNCYEKMTFYKKAGYYLSVDELIVMTTKIRLVSQQNTEAFEKDKPSNGLRVPSFLASITTP